MNIFGLSIQLSKLREEIEFRAAKEEYERIMSLQNAREDGIIEESWNEAEHPRDEDGKFSIKWEKLIGTTTAKGQIVCELKSHFASQAKARGVSFKGALDALKNPLHVTPEKQNERGEPSVQYIGRYATVAFNPLSNTAITAWITGKSKVRKYEGVGK